MTRIELDLLYSAKSDVEKAHALADASQCWTTNATKIRDGLSRALWTMKRLIDNAVIEHQAENHHHDLQEAAKQPGGGDVETHR